MQRWFLSYNSRDFDLVDGLQQALKRKLPEAEIFFAPKSLRAGAYWLPMLADGIAQATAFALIVGENGLGPWQVMEYYEAIDRRVKSPDFPVVLVLLEGQSAPGLAFLRQLHWIVTSDPGAEQTSARLVDAAAGGGGRPSELWRFTSPYRGLAAMTEADSDFFFGRDRETGKVLSALADNADRLPILLGNSGVGKSSLAQAGVLAALKRQARPGDTNTGGLWPAAFHDSRRWCSLTLKPGSEPIKSLVEPFLDTWQFAATDPERARQQNGWIELLRDNKGTLRDLLDATERRHQELNQAKPPAFFIYVDQGEELYVRSEERMRRRFSTLLAEALGDPRLHAMMSMRSDFLGALQNDPPLYSVHEKVDVPPLREAELYEAVSRPAALLSARFENDGLAAQIAERAAEESIRDAGALPLLSYLLDDMWTQMVGRGDGVLRLPSHAMELGGVLANRADAFLARHPKAEDTLRRVLTLKLATVREDGEPTRRLAQRSEFTDEEWRLVSELADHPHRLLVTVTTETGQTYAEVAHEAIFRRWGKLREWIASEREFLVWKSKLEAACRTWEQSPENSRNDALLMGLALAQAQSWLARRAEDLPKIDRDFIDQSVQREVIERRQRESLRRRMFGTAIGALLVVSALAVFSFLQWREALRQRDHAQHAVMSFLQRLMTGFASGETAMADLGRAIQLDPTDATNYFLRAMLYFQKGDWDHALSDFDQVIRLDSTSIAAYFSRATTRENKNDYDGAIADYDKIINLDPQSSLAYNGRCFLYYKKLTYDRALPDCDRAIELNPRYAIAFNNRGNVYFAKKDNDRALADYSRAIEIDPNNENSYYWYENRGNIYYNRRDYDHAIADYTEVVQHNPKYAVGFNDRGNAYFGKGDNERALSDYSRAIEIDSNNENSYYWYENRGNIYYNRGDYDRAIADYTEVVRHNPKYAVGYNDRGNAYFAKGDYDRAEADYTMAIRTAPDDKRAYFWYWNRGNIYLFRNEFDRSIADYDESIRINAEFAAAYQYRCRARMSANKDLRLALQDCDTALRLKPGDAGALEVHGYTELRLEEFDQAIADFDAALRVNGQLPYSLYGRGLAKLRKGDAAGAEADMAAAKALKPDIASELARIGLM